MASKSSRGGDRPTGPNKSTQGKPLSPHYSPARSGDTTGNGSWDASAKVVKATKRGPQRGSRKSF